MSTGRKIKSESECSVFGEMLSLYEYTFGSISSEITFLVCRTVFSAPEVYKVFECYCDIECHCDHPKL